MHPATGGVIKLSSRGYCDKSKHGHGPLRTKLLEAIRRGKVKVPRYLWASVDKAQPIMAAQQRHPVLAVKAVAMCSGWIKQA